MTITRGKHASEAKLMIEGENRGRQFSITFDIPKKTKGLFAIRHIDYFYVQDSLSQPTLLIRIPIV